MWRIKYWLSKLGFRLWYRFSGGKVYMAFRHTCGSEVVGLADYRGFGPEFQCFNCDALVPAKDIIFRTLSKEELEEIRKKEEKQKSFWDRYPEAYFRQAILPSIVI